MRLSTGVTAVETCTGAFLDPLLGFKIRGATTSKDFEVDTEHGSIGKDRDNFGAKSSGAVETPSEHRGVTVARPVQGAQMSVKKHEATPVESAQAASAVIAEEPWDESVLSKAVVERMDRIAGNREGAIAFLRKGGFLDDEGNLSPRYRPG
jgi:hypothetical protein